MPAMPRWFLPQHRKQHFDVAKPGSTPRIRKRALLSIFSKASKNDRHTTGTHSTESTYIGTVSNPQSPPTTVPETSEDKSTEGLDERAPVPSNPSPARKPIDRSSFSAYPRLTKNDLKPLPPLPDLHPPLSGIESEEPVPLVILSVRRRLGSGGSQKSKELKERLKSRFST
ncbi:MAG: hypothetical protein L6R42_009853 [Xanthoria sp. 1 TBL-2021]|nr:MAG: hypothetical protein L6R42_009853 [Xanthoria sp. 1 TBL-2021]